MSNYMGMGTPWHEVFLSREEGDPRRDKRRCKYYIKSKNYCEGYHMKCIGSAHCSKYRERETEEQIENKETNDEIIPQKKKTVSPGVFMLDMVRKQKPSGEKKDKE